MALVHEGGAGVKYRLIITGNKVTLSYGYHFKTFQTTGPNDPRIAEAVMKCKAAGFDIQIV
jgi:hypothetical protein